MSTQGGTHFGWGGARWSSEVFAASGVDDGPATYTITRERQLKFI